MIDICLCEMPRIKAKFRRTWECTNCGKPEQPRTDPEAIETINLRSRAEAAEAAEAKLAASLAPLADKIAEMSEELTVARRTGGVEVKALEWRDDAPNGEERNSYADAVTGSYTAFSFRSLSRGKRMIYGWQRRNGSDVHVESFEEAKAGAQADYEARIRSALATPPRPDPEAPSPPEQPEREAVAWMDDGSTRAGSASTEFRVITAATKAGMPAAVSAAYVTPLFTAPPDQTATIERLTRERDEARDDARKASERHAVSQAHEAANKIRAEAAEAALAQAERAQREAVAAAYEDAAKVAESPDHTTDWRARGAIAGAIRARSGQNEGGERG